MAPGLTLLLTVGAALLLAACGSGDDAPGASTPAATSGPSGAAATTPATSGDTGPIICEFFAKHDIEVALGETLGDAQIADLEGTTFCAYQPAMDRGVVINVSHGYTREMFDATVAESARLLSTEAVPVEGVGDSAAWLFPYMAVLKKDVFFRISIYSPQLTFEQQMAAAKDLAAKAAGRI